LLLARLGREIGSPLPVLWKLTCKNNVVPVGTENSLELGLIELLGRIDERRRSLLGSIKTSGAGPRTRECSWSWFRSGLLANKKD
jgi:hypothetical protein